MATAAAGLKPMVSPEEFLASQPKVSPEEYLQSAVEPAAPPVSPFQGVGPDPTWRRPSPPPGQSDEWLPPLRPSPVTPPQVAQKGPGFKDVEIGLRQGAVSMSNMMLRPSEVTGGGRTASGRPLSEVVADDIGPKPEEVAERQGVGNKIVQGISRAPVDAARYGMMTVAAGGNPILGMGAADTLENSGADSSPAEAVQAGAKGAAFGTALKPLSGLSRAARIPAGAAIGGGATALSGGSPGDVAASAVTMGALSGLHGKVADVEEKAAASVVKAAEPKVSPEEFLEKEEVWPDRSAGVVLPPGVITRKVEGSHLSSNVDSLKGGFQQRDLGISIARTPKEELSSPTVNDQGGRRGRVEVSVNGQGLDYENDPAHREFIDGLHDNTDWGSGEPRDVGVINALRKLGIDWVNGWNGIGGSPELHVINADAVRIKPTVRESSATVMGSGLGALQPHYDAAVAVLKGDVEATRALIAKRDVALAALKKAESTPSEKDAGHKILEYFTGERDVWGARMNQVMERLRKVVPDHTEQEGLSLMRDFKSRPGELQEWLAGTHPTMRAISDPAKWLTAQERIEQMRPAIEKALNPTPGMMAADQVLTNIAELSLLEGRKRGFLESNISSDEYVTHLLHPPDLAEFRPLTEKAGSLMGGKIGRRFAFSESRQYPTLLDAVADNQKPRTLNALTAFTIHADKFATSRATALLVDQLKGTGVGKWSMGRDKVPDGWVEIAPHAHPFQNTVSALSQAGDPKAMTQKLYVPKFIEEALRPITDPDFTGKIAGFMRLRQWQAFTKAIQLGMSAFHATAMNFMAAANMGAKGLAKGWMADRDSAAFLDGERRFIAHGGTTSIQGKTFEAYRSLEPGSIPGPGDIGRRLPVLRQVDQAANKITEFTFGKIQRQFKVTDFALKEAAWTAKNPAASAAQKAAALQSIAKEINAVYGGLHWENLGVNKMTLSVARSIMLAPDWTLSNLFNVKTISERGPGGDAARMFWARQVVGGMAATQAMSLLLSGKMSQRPTDVYMGTDKDGQEIYQNMFFKGASGDLITLVKNWKRLGFWEGTGKTLIGKTAPGVRTALQAAFNVDYAGQPIIPKGTDFLPATLRGAGIAALDMAPLPLSAGNLARMVTGPQAERTTLPEYMTTPFVGTPPVHVPPDGMRMTNQGLKPKKEAPAKSFWNQTLNRKGPPPVRLGR